MQTFLPYPNFFRSAMVLDKQRCWKQVVETAQIISILENPNNDKPKAWQNHPAVKMWVGHTEVLKIYFDCFLAISKFRHKINTKYEFYNRNRIDWSLNKIDKKFGLPWWMRKKKFHRAMRARLIEKDEEFYLPIFPKDKGFNDGFYFWPDMETKEFKVIK